MVLSKMRLWLRLWFLMALATVTVSVQFNDGLISRAMDMFSSFLSVGEDSDTAVPEGSLHKLKELIDANLEVQKNRFEGSRRLKRHVKWDNWTELARDPRGVAILRGVEPRVTIPVDSPLDMEVFQVGNDWVAAVVRQDFGNATSPIFKIGRNDEVTTAGSFLPTLNATTIRHVHIDGADYLVTGEYNVMTAPEALQAGSGVYKISPQTLKVETVQTIHTRFVADIAVWRGAREEVNDNFLIVAPAGQMIGTVFQYEVNCPVFKWQGAYYDQFTEVKAFNPKSVEHFQIGAADYLAVANHCNDRGDRNIDSVIYRYNYHEDRFVTFQKIKTNAATDMKFFAFGEGLQEEQFLVVANKFKITATDKIDYRVNSIIYKFSEDRFVPFQTIPTEAAVHWLPIKGHNGEFVLAVAEVHKGVRLFQYNGWKFVKTQVEYTQHAFTAGARTLKAFPMGDQVFIGVANEFNDGSEPCLYSFLYDHHNDLAVFHHQLEQWARTALEAINATNLDGLATRVDDAPKVMTDEIVVDGDLTFEKDVNVPGILHTENFMYPAAQIALNRHHARYLLSLKERLGSSLDKLVDVEEALTRAMRVNEDAVLEGSIHFKNAEFSCAYCTMGSIQVENLNGRPLEGFLSNVVYLDSNWTHRGAVEFVKANFLANVDVSILNNIAMEDYVTLSGDSIFQEEVLVKGTVEALEGLDVDGFADGIDFQVGNILLAVGNQMLNGTFYAQDISIGSLQTGLLNDLDLNHYFDQVVQKSTGGIIDGRKKLTRVVTSNMIVNGTIGELDMDSLYEHAFYLTSNRSVTGHHQYENMTIESVVVENSINDMIIPDDFLLQVGGDYQLEELFFMENVTIDHLQVIKSIDDIKVTDGKLDLLVLYGEEPQVVVTGPKALKSVHLSRDSTVHGLINGYDLNNWNETIEIDLESKKFFENVTIDGEVKIQDLNVGDLQSNHSSLNRLFQHGVKLNSKNLTSLQKLTFATNITVANNLQVSSINSDNPNEWIKLNGPSQAVSGTKTFSDGIYVQHSALIHALNGLNVGDLDEDMLKIHGDQVIAGRKIISNFSAGRVNSEKVLIDDEDFGTALTVKGMQVVPGLSEINGTLNVINGLSARELTVRGLINRVKLEELVNDTLFKDAQDQIVSGKKSFLHKINVENLQVQGKVQGFDFRDFVDDMALKNETISIAGNLLFQNNVIIEELDVKGNIDGIQHSDFHLWLLKVGNQVLLGTNEFGNVHANEGMDVMSGNINSFSIQELITDTVYVDAPIKLKDVTFGDTVIVTKPVTVQGQVQGWDLSEQAVLKDAEYQFISAPKTFKEGWTIEGNLEINTLSGIDFNRMCTFANGPYEVSDLLVLGDVAFLEEPLILHSVNGENLNNLLEKLWFKNGPANITGPMEFVNVNLQSAVTKGLFGKLNLTHFQSIYFSKTKVQQVVANYYFNSIEIVGNLMGSMADVAGLVNGIDLAAFNDTVMKDSIDQYVTNHFYKMLQADNVHVGGQVNGIDLDSETMQYDSEKNIVAATKTIAANLEVEKLSLAPGVKIQGVDILKWNEEMLRKTGDFTINNRKTFNNVTFSGNVQVLGKVNDLEFSEESLMTKSTSQEVTSAKTLVNKNETVMFADLLVEGLINNINIEGFYSDVYWKDEPFSIYTGKRFNSTLHLTSATVKEYYQGHNITDLYLRIEKGVQFGSVEHLYPDLATSLQDIVVAQDHSAVYLWHYTSMGKMDGHVIEKLVEFTYNGISMTEPYLVAVKENCNSTDLTISLSTWNDSANEFQAKVYHNTPLMPTAIAGVVSHGSFYLAVATTQPSETFVNQNRQCTPGHNAEIVMGGQRGLSSPSSYIIKFNLLDRKLGSSIPIATNTTSDVEAVYLDDPRQACFFFANYMGNSSVLLCDHPSMNGFSIQQMFPTLGAFQAKSVTIGTKLFLVIGSHGNRAGIKEAIDVWKFDSGTRKFHVDHALNGANGIHLDVINYHGEAYLVVIHSHAMKSLLKGEVKLFRYSEDAKRFLQFQMFEAEAPLQCHFTVLPSDQLALVILDSAPVHNINVYVYKGLSGFQRETAATLENASFLAAFNFPVDKWGKSFIIAASKNYNEVLKATFKGHW